MKKYLVDASVVLKSLLKENASVQQQFAKISTQVVIKSAELISVNFLDLEVLNGFRYSLKTEKECEEFFNEFVKLPIKKIALSKTQYIKTINIAYQNNTTVYDTSYHILAKARGATFLTCDEKYYKKAKELGNIELLG